MDDFEDLFYPELESLEDEDDCENTCTCPGCLLLHEPSDTEATMSDEEPEPQAPIQLEQTRRKKLALEVQSLAPKVLKILDAISEQGMTLSLFLDALSWGDESCHSNDRIRFARTGLMLSEELPGILERWYRPPRNQHKGRRPVGARQNLQKFAIKCVADLLEYEIEHIAPLFASPPDELSQAHLTSFNFEDFIRKVSAGAPVLWDVLERLVFSAKQRARNTHKSPAMVLLFNTL